MIKYLIVGLGNIGPEYHETRHNIGFMTVEALARINNAPPFIDGRYGFTTSFSIKGRQLILLKPSTFMNLSGLAVRYWMQKEKLYKKVYRRAFKYNFLSIFYRNHYFVQTNKGVLYSVKE